MISMPFSVWLAFCYLQIRVLCCLVCCHLLHYCEWLMDSIYLGCAILTFSLLHSRLHYFNFPPSPSESESCSVVSDSLWPHGVSSPWNSPGQDTGVGSLSLLQESLPNPGIKPRSPTLQVDSSAEAQGKPIKVIHI